MRLLVGLVGNSLILHWLNRCVAELRRIQIDCLSVGEDSCCERRSLIQTHWSNFLVASVVNLLPIELVRRLLVRGKLSLRIYWPRLWSPMILKEGLLMMCHRRYTPLTLRHRHRYILVSGSMVNLQSEGLRYSCARQRSWTNIFELTLLWVCPSP